MRIPRPRLRRRHRRGEPLIVHRTGARLTGAGICWHGDLLFGIRLSGTGLDTGAETNVDFIMSRCTAAQLIGTLIALVQADGGDKGRHAWFDAIEMGELTAAEEIAQRAARRGDDSSH